jgi:adenylate cyclase
VSGSELKQRLAAILAADAAGYSRLMATDERATVAALDAARSVFRTQIESSQGRVIDMAGDSVLAVFETATGAVSAALAVQAELAGLTADVAEDRRMRFRIGVHLGDVIEKSDGTVYGDGVNIAARLEGLAEPGGITVSDSLRNAVRGKVSARFDDLGEQTVKNIADPVRAFRVKPADAVGDPTAIAHAAVRMSAPVPGFGGRPAIAVLPFANMSGDPEQEYFADGLAEDILTRLIEKGDGTVYGDGVNIAARLEGLAMPGGITVSESIRTAVKGKVGARFEDQGQQTVKNIPDPVRAFRVGIAGSTPPQPPPAVGETVLSLPDRPSIAVLPFNNMSGDPEQEYFADGMVEDIITELSRFQRLFVIARNTSFTYKGRSVDVKKIAAELGVHFVLEGSVRKAGDRVRITAQLIDGESGRHVWAERYEDVLSDVFELQERITRQVVGSMVPEIEAEEMRQQERGRRRFSETDDIALRATKAVTDAMFGGASALTLDAIELAERAIARDRNCQLAWFALGSSHVWRAFMGWTQDRGSSIAAARDAAESLIRLAPNDSRSYFQRGIAESIAGNFAGGTADLRRAHALNPNDSIVLFFLSLSEAMDGNIERAKDLAAQAMRMSPRDRWVGTAHLARAVCAFIERNLPALHDSAALAIQSEASHPLRRVMMIAWAAEAGDAAALRLHLDKLQSVTPKFIANLFSGAYRPLHRPEHMQMLLDTLRKVGLGN